MNVGTVQGCGCIALPEELQEKTGHYPGATFEFRVAEDGAELILTFIERRSPQETAPGVHLRGASCSV
jgi:hypothetical protein